MKFFDAIAQVVSERTGYDTSKITPDSTFEEFGIDSLDTVELLMSLEDIVGFRIEPNRAIKTVRELDEFMQSIQE